MHWFIDPIKNHYFDFSGRASRKEFWMFVLFTFIFGIVTGIIDEIIGVSVTNTILALAIFIPSLAIAVRRLHDTGRTGWWLLLSFIPFIGAIVLIIFYVLEGDEGTNNYGANPYGGGAMSDVPPAQPEVPVEASNTTSADSVSVGGTSHEAEAFKEPEENEQKGYGS